MAPHSHAVMHFPRLRRHCLKCYSIRFLLHLPPFLLTQRFLRHNLNLRKQKDAYPFSVALKIPCDFNIITKPMGFATIDKKLAASNLAKKLEPTSANKLRYYSILNSCSRPDHVVSQHAKKLEDHFVKVCAVPFIHVCSHPPLCRS
jgi:hypothetical protein